MSNNDETTYKRIDFIVRPSKVCILIFNQSPHWKYLYKKIIELNTSLWGGKHVLIIPTDGHSISATDWRLMEAFSPDSLGMYVETLSDLKVFNRPAYDEWYERQAETRRAMGEARFSEWIAENESTMRLNRSDISNGLKKELYERLRPSVYAANHVIEHHFTNNSEASWPLSYSTQLLDISKKPLSEIYETKRHDDDDLDIMEAMLAGRLSESTKNTLTASSVSVKAIPEGMTIGNIIADLINTDSMLLRTTLAQGDVDAEYVYKMPYTLSMLNLMRAYKIRPGRQSREGILIVVGDKLEDVCLAHNLAKLQENVFWISSKLVTDAHAAFRRSIRQHESGQEVTAIDERIGSALDVIRAFASKVGYGMNSDKVVELISTSLTPAQLRNRNTMMGSMCYSPQAFRNSRIIQPEQIDVSYTPIVMETDNYTAQQAMTFVNGNSVHLLETPKPINFTAINDKLRWITSFTIDGYMAPKLSHSATQVMVDRTAVHEARIDKDGITYLSPGISWFNNTAVDANVTKPKVRMVNAFETFETLFEKMGYSASISDKGMFMRHTIEKFGSLEQTAEWLLKPGVRKLLSVFTHNTVVPENRAERIYLDFSNRAYLDFQQIKKACGRNVDAAELVDVWTGNGTLKRGVILQCKRCACSAWYVAGSFDDKFTCQRCGNTEIIRKTNWKMPEEPKWYYSLDEPVHQFFYNHGDVPLLTLEHYRKSSEYFDYVTEIKLTKPNGTAEVELDIACLVNGNVVLGEAKSGELESPHLQQLRRIENTLKPIPFEIVFSTAQNSVNRAVKASIASDFRNPRILTKRDIYA